MLPGICELAASLWPEILWRYKPRLFDRRGVGCARSPRSHSYLCSRGLMRGSCLSPEASLRLVKFVPDEFVTCLPPCDNRKALEDWAVSYRFFIIAGTLFSSWNSLFASHWEKILTTVRKNTHAFENITTFITLCTIQIAIKYFLPYTRN